MSSGVTFRRMNFLEGLKRLFIVLAILFGAIFGSVGWDNVQSPYWCAAPLAQNQLPNAQSSSATQDLRVHDSCPSPDKIMATKVLYATGYGGAAAAVVLMIFAVLRWIILGFWPGASRKP